MNIENVFASTTDVVYPSMRELLAELRPAIELLPTVAQAGFDANFCLYVGPVRLVAALMWHGGDKVEFENFVPFTEDQEDDCRVCAQWRKGDEEFCHIWSEDLCRGNITYDNTLAKGGASLMLQYEAVETPIGTYSVGSNMCGYMPDEDPAVFDSYADARAYLLEEFEQAIEYYEDFAALVEQHKRLREQVVQYAPNDGDLSVTFLGRAYWLVKSDPLTPTQYAELRK